MDITCNLKCGAGEEFVYIPFTHIVVKPVCGAHGVLYHTCTFLHQNNFAVKLRNQKKKVLVSPCMFSTQETELVMAETEQEKTRKCSTQKRNQKDACLGLKRKSVHTPTGQQFCYICQIVKKKHPGQRIHRKFIVIFTAVEEKKDSVDQIEKHFRKIALWIPAAKAKPVHQRTGKENTEGTYHRDRKNRIFPKKDQRHENAKNSDGNTKIAFEK